MTRVFDKCKRSDDRTETKLTVLLSRRPEIEQLLRSLTGSAGNGGNGGQEAESLRLQAEGEAHMAAGRTAEAIAAFTAALVHTPANAELREALHFVRG